MMTFHMMNAPWFDPESSGITIFNPAAVQLFHKARQRAQSNVILNILLGRPRYLQPLDAHFTAESGHDAGIAAVHLPLRAIQGSVNRSQDFDSAFLPLKDTLADRWVCIASMLLHGTSLPPVDVLRVGERYYVIDGHHRLSVLRMLGQIDVDALVHARL
jgi:uncharacterized ParB-like nuclease family protein